ncbi:Uncharacterised protein [[Clostridium] sordellii]|uniref:hypothetical protein n=1 Tax=Paraclostridium sordellii TaxID=1505 RepID=UPI0005E62500|nr:hypothetical protein [Paeniclostridium sordellii]CEN84165.1 Uncharacterised protein [[Clostridium] sordellii] [Paeniclostridium sordellii]CEO09650.1 Uncharacterised protein [[Clostridium] sordellii] [Paeniclostridium sordellii]
MKTIVRKYGDKEYIMKLGARQKKMYSDITKKPILTDQEPTYSDMITLIRCAISFSNKFISEDEVLNLADEIGDKAIYELYGDLLKAMIKEFDDNKDIIPSN